MKYKITKKHHRQIILSLLRMSIFTLVPFTLLFFGNGKDTLQINLFNCYQLVGLHLTPLTITNPALWNSTFTLYGTHYRQALWQQHPSLSLLFITI